MVGLNRTGDSQQTYFTVQTLANAMRKMGVLISPGRGSEERGCSFHYSFLAAFRASGREAGHYGSSVGDAKSLLGRRAAHERLARPRRTDLC